MQGKEGKTQLLTQGAKEAACRGNVVWWRQFPVILAPPRSTVHPHGHTSEGLDSVSDKGFSSSQCLKDSVLSVTPKFKFHRQCPPTQIPARQAWNHPTYVCSEKLSIRFGNLDSDTKDWERDKTHRVSCYFAFQWVNKGLIQWEERKTSSRSTVVFSWTGSPQRAKERDLVVNTGYHSADDHRHSSSCFQAWSKLSWCDSASPSVMQGE